MSQKIIAYSFLFFVAGFFGIVSAQPNTENSRNIILNVKDQQQRIDRLILSGNYSEALALINEVKQNSAVSNNTKDYADALLSEGIIAYNQSKYEYSINLLDSSLNLYSILGDLSGKTASLNNKAKALGALNRETEALALLKQTESDALKNKDDKGLSYAFYLHGSILTDRGLYVDAEDYFQKSLDLRLKLKDSAAIAASYSFLGLNHSYLGDYAKGLDYIQKSIVIRNKIHDKRGLANSYLTQYKILYVMQDWEEALQSEFKSLELCLEINDEQCVSGRYTNIGELYLRLGKYEEALKFHYKALQISRKVGIKNRESLVLNNIAETLMQQNKPEQAKVYMDSAFALRIKMNDQEGLMHSYLTLANFNYQKKDFRKSIEAAKKSEEINSKLRLPTVEMELNLLLSKNYSALNDNKNALVCFQKYITIRDSTYNIETSRQLTQKQLKFEFAQQQKIELLEQQHKDALAEQEIQKARFVRNSLFGGVAVLILILFMVFRSNFHRKMLNRNLRELNLQLQDQKQELEDQKERIEEQHALIETKNREITDSIYYAKNIQSALMPADTDFSRYFSDHFIYFKPKDIISGDFYWISEKEDKIIFVTADCTGHGIPGGFMSMLGISLLNEIINEYALTEPALVMSKLRKKLIATLKQKGETGEQQDGMDLSFLVIDKANNKISYATANHTFYILRTENDEIKMIPFKGDKQPVGIYAGRLKPFNQATISYQPGDLLYTMSDGYADQFGGPKGKKFKYKQLLDLLKSNSGKPFAEQYGIVDQTFVDWKGSLEQVDDVCVIGIRL